MILSNDPILERAEEEKVGFSEKILEVPPDGLWWMLSLDPTLEVTVVRRGVMAILEVVVKLETGVISMVTDMERCQTHVR